MRWLGLVLACGLMVACSDEVAVDGDDSSGNGSGGGGGTGEPTLPQPEEQFVPAVTGTCPAIATGTVSFAPAAIAPRDVSVWVGADPLAQDGPLVFYWHGAGSQPGEAVFGLGQTVIDAITAQGGMVVAPYHDPAAGQFPWFLTTGAGEEQDLVLADEILACAREQVGIDMRRIHAIGMSAGGLQTTQMSYRRSGYMASVVAYSGGKLGSTPDQNPENKYSAMIFHGGPSDVVLVNFQTLSEAFHADLAMNGRFSFICNHGDGHTIPAGSGAHAWQFFQDHPYGVTPAPYVEAGALPATFPAYCSL